MTLVADTARSTVTRRSLLLADAPVVAMVSGGADSVAMLRLLTSGDLGRYELRVLHVNHMLRGAESDADQSFVEAMCAELGVECRSVRVDVSAWAEEEGGLNLEDAGRRVRYEAAEAYLDELAAPGSKASRGAAIATAHTLDDRIETFFMRALAGAGAGALAGIPYRRGRIVRPLLDVERSALREYLGELGQPWREDATNADTTRSRSAVRHELLPAAERINPQFRATMRRTLGLLADDDELLTSMAEAFAHDFADADDARVSFGRDMMRTLTPAMARRTVRAALASTFPEAARMPADHVEAIVLGLAEDAFARDLPEGLRAYTEYDRLVVALAAARQPSVTPSLLPIPGVARLGDAGTIEAQPADPEDLAGSAESVVIDADGVAALSVTSMRAGDRVRPLGMEGSRKLSDMLTDAKVPRRARRAVPVIRDGERIVWVVGVRMSDEYRVGPSTVRAVRLTWHIAPKQGAPGEGAESRASRS